MSCLISFACFAELLGKGNKRKLKIYVSGKRTIDSSLCKLAPLTALTHTNRWWVVFKSLTQSKHMNKINTWQYVSNWLWLDVYWNWLSDKICISFTKEYLLLFTELCMNTPNHNQFDSRTYLSGSQKKSEKSNIQSGIRQTIRKKLACTHGRTAEIKRNFREIW